MPGTRFDKFLTQSDKKEFCIIGGDVDDLSTVDVLNYHPLSVKHQCEVLTQSDEFYRTA